MKKGYLLLPFAAALAAFLPLAASAHEHQIFKIGGNYYQFTVGSLNEPIAVDDKTGVDLRVEMVTEEHAMEKHDEKGGMHMEEKFPPVTGLEKTLKVELDAGGKTKKLELMPAWNDPGAYRAMFTPTVQTTYAYRFIGIINNTPVDLTFSCNPAGNPQTADAGVIKISDAIERMSKVGAFGCPAAKADLGFPEASPSLYDLNARIESGISSNSLTNILALGLSIIAILLGISALLKSRKA